MLLAGCREMPRYFSGDETVARAGGRELRMRDVRRVIPQGLTGGDSAAYVKMYVDRWVRKQLKLQEAEILFSESAGDIDRMVEEYRQALLIRKLDQHYVDRSVDTVFTDDEIAAYYNAHKADFRLDRPIVKGRITVFCRVDGTLNSILPSNRVISLRCASSCFTKKQVPFTSINASFIYT